MDCKKIQRVIFRFIYGEADGLELLHIRAHLDRCTECRREREIIDGILTKIRGAVNLDVEAPPSGMCDRMRERLKHEIPIKDGSMKAEPEAEPE